MSTALCVTQRTPFDPRQQAVPPNKTTATDLIQGIAAHDLYHAGQIQLLKRL
ncbi:MAG: hypothetical protein U0746_16700 [Gemmataceae bacterium]